MIGKQNKGVPEEEPVPLPHLSWKGPGPERELEAYALAIIVRLIGTGLKDRTQRTPDMLPSSLTSKNLSRISGLYAFIKDRLELDGVKTYEGMLNLFKESTKINMIDWRKANRDKITKAEQELINYVDTKNHVGFRAYG